MIFAALVVAFIVLNVLDMVLTDRIIDRGGHESNPLLAWVMGRPGTNWGLFKMGIAFLAVVLLYAFAPPVWREVALGALIAAWVYVVYHNATVLRRMD
jgi:uncharacterized BrkB/YihY/UPF0761 family membrane protein